jgi:hypothetical protein
MEPEKHDWSADVAHFTTAVVALLTRVSPQLTDFEQRLLRLEERESVATENEATIAKTFKEVGERLLALETEMAAARKDIECSRDLQTQLTAIAPNLDELLAKVRALYGRRKNAPPGTVQ